MDQLDTRDWMRWDCDGDAGLMRGSVVEMQWMFA